MKILFLLIQTMSVFLVVAYLYCKSPWFKPLTTEALRLRDAALFMSIIRDQKNIYDKAATIFSAKAFKIAERTLSILVKGFDRDTAVDMARIIHQETGVGAVAITDTERVPAFVGTGSDHHQPGSPISSPLTRQAIAENKVIFADGVQDHYACTLSPSCPLNSVLVVPLNMENDVIGAIKLNESKSKRFLNMIKSFGEGIAGLLSNQLLLSRYEKQKQLLVMAELKPGQAQVNAHFLFNALNTIISIIRKNSDRARELLIHLSNFLRRNLKRESDFSTLKEELDHVNSYLKIVDYIRSDISGVYVVCGRGAFYTELTLKVLESRSHFVRCHKQFLINLEQVDEIILGENLLAQITTKAGHFVPVSRRYLKRLKELLGI